ncbi:hypothetical protein [Paenibacillus sp. WLX2291]|uniref:hypothetical protein n=1 Tax=Paenibacillus sp. WLX2291 TaxID=3296934 RepID=UPI0039841A6B
MRSTTIATTILSMLFTLILSACSAAPKTDVVIIPDNDESPIVDQTSKPVQVKKIYRLPGHFSNTGRLMGWSAHDEVISAMGFMSVLEQGTLEQMAYPFEKSKPNTVIGHINYNTFLSPDGNYFCEILNSSNETVLKLVSMQTGKKTILTRVSDSSTYVQNVTWSPNSQYVSYLIDKPVYNMNAKQSANLHIYNMASHTDTSYPLTLLAAQDSLFHVDIANNGTSVLLQSYQANHDHKKVLTMVEAADKKLDIQYEREIGGDDVSWITNDQFVFLGSDESLYEYDRRNGELSVILDHVLDFDFSPDRKSIAYTSAQDQNVVFVGKMQGRNVLYREPVYRGMVPYNMFWNQDSKSLLIQGSKPWNPAQTSSADGYADEALVIELE